VRLMSTTSKGRNLSNSWPKVRNLLMRSRRRSERSMSKRSEEKKKKLWSIICRTFP
jgi:hypothetical protein